MTTFNDRLTIMRHKLEESTEGVWDDDMLKDDYNHFQRSVAAKTNPPELLSEYDFTASGNARKWALPSTFRSVKALYYGTRKMMRQDLNEVEGIDLTGSGAPSYYTIINGSVALYPVPNITASMHLKYVAWPTTISSTSTTINIPDDYLPCVEAGVLARAYEQTGEVDMADLNWRAYDRYLHDLMNQAERENERDHVTQPAEAW